MMSDKIKLTITQVKEPQAIGTKGAEKLSFKGKDAEGKDYWYFTFSKRLFPSIKELVDKEAEVDVEVSEREWDGNTYTDRKVTEVYVDGKSVAPKSSGGYGGGGYGRSYDKESIESQVAFKGVIELMTHDVVTKKDKLGKMAIAWATERLDAKTTPNTVKPEPDIEQAEEDTEELFPPDPIHAKEAAQPTSTSIIDLEWLKEQLGILKSKEIKAYSNTTILSYLNAITRQKSKDIAEAVSKLDEKQAAEFTKKVQEAIEMA